MRGVVDVSVELLRQMPLPAPDAQADKDSRGRVVVVGGSRMVPGAVLLSGSAALRAGAGKVQLAVPRTLAIPIGIALMEGGVAAFADTEAGEPSSEAWSSVCPIIQGVDAVLIGPGFMAEASARELTIQLLERVAGPLYVIDAMAIMGLWHSASVLARHSGRIILTPNAGEMAALSGLSKDEVCRDPLSVASEAANRLHCVIVLKGATTFIAMPSGTVYRHAQNLVGLATAGSGDVLAGVIAGLAACGANALEAALHGVFVHAQAGVRVAGRIAPIGFIARELITEIPALLQLSRG